MKRWVLGCLVALLPLAASSAEIYLENETKLATPDAIPAELVGCGVQTQLPKEIAAWAGNVTLVEEDTEQGKFLDLRITKVHSSAGLGRNRSVSVTGTLREGSEELRSFRGKRVSRSLTRSDCEALGKATIDLAKDIAAWLTDYATASPLLGDAR